MRRMHTCICKYPPDDDLSEIYRDLFFFLFFETLPGISAQRVFIKFISRLAGCTQTYYHIKRRRYFD